MPNDEAPKNPLPEPYLTVGVVLPGAESEGVSNPDKTVPCKILPRNVIAYHAGYSWGTFIYLTTGQAFCLECTVAVYEADVAAYWKRVLTRKEVLKSII
jgi:hypothetical protein